LALNQQFTIRLSKPMSANLALKALQLGCSTSELARTLIASGAKQNGLGDFESLV
jgi:predicted HicB family RNase H-like nuclease